MDAGNAEKKRKRDAEKRKNAFNMKKYERIIAAEANYDTIVYNGITILMEDDGYAFDFVSQLLKKTYTHLNFDLSSLNEFVAICKKKKSIRKCCEKKENKKNR